MSLAEMSGRDLDRLADFVAGGLEPTEAAEVARLVHTEPDWSAAHAELTSADGAVRAQLSSYGAMTGPMPADVIARLEIALAAERRAAPSEHGRESELGPDPRQRRAGLAATVVSLDAARQRRRRRFTTLTAAAAVLVAIGTGWSLSSQEHDQLAAVGRQCRLRRSGSPTGKRRAPAPPKTSPALPPNPSTAVCRSVTRAPPSPPAVRATPRPICATRPSSGRPRPLPRAPRRAHPSSHLASTRRTAGVWRSPPSWPAVSIRWSRPTPVRCCRRTTRASTRKPAVIVVVRQTAGVIVVAVGELCGVDGADELDAVRV